MLYNNNTNLWYINNNFNGSRVKAIDITETLLDFEFQNMNTFLFLSELRRMAPKISYLCQNSLDSVQQATPDNLASQTFTFNFDAIVRPPCYNGRVLCAVSCCVLCRLLLLCNYAAFVCWAIKGPCEYMVQWLPKKRYKRTFCLFKCFI
jgi:hypothetical protein